MATPFDPVQAAFEKATRDFKAELQDDVLYNEILQVKSIEQVYDATDQLQAEQAKKGHLRHLSKISPFLTRLNDYAEVVKVFIQLKPDLLTLIWGPIALLLQWASVLKTSFDAIVNATAEIGLALPEFQQAVRLFDQNDNIKDVLLLFFKDILDFYLVALRFFRSKGWRIVFEALWPKHREKIKRVTELIQQHTLLMRKEVQLEQIQREHDARAQSLAHFETTEKANRRQEFHRIKTNISPRSYDEELNRFRIRTCRETGKWLINDPTFIKWLDVSEKSSRLLWLQGIPGAGKTFLSSVVVEKTTAISRTLFAFLSHATKSSALAILHSLIFYLASDHDDLEAALCEMSRENLRSSMDVAYKILSGLLACAGPVFVVIDGLDEIEELERSLLVKKLLQLLTHREKIKILVSSRPEADLKTTLSDRAECFRVNERNAENIRTYVKQKTQAWFEKRVLSPHERAEIEGWLAPITSKAEGLWPYHPELT